MLRYLAAFAVGLAICVRAGISWAEDPVRSQVWLRASIPPQPGGELPGSLLKRGDAVTPVDKIECKTGGVTTVCFGPENKLQARIPTWLLSTAKPPPLPEAREAAGKPQDDLARLKGSWGVVARSVLGTLNPEFQDELDAGPAAEYWLRREMLDRGLGGDKKITVRGSNRAVASGLQLGFEFDGSVFTDKETALWQMGASNCDRPLEQSQSYRGTYEFRIDAATTPKRLDFLPRTQATRDVLAIYEFDGDFLKIAIAPSWVLKRPSHPLDQGQAQWRRPAGFDAESAKQAIVLWLSRLDEREYPARSGSLADMPTLLTAPGLETSERLSEPLKKLLGTWREVVHEQGGSRDYAGLTWKFAPGRVTVWYPELPDHPDSYAVFSQPGFIVDPTKDPPRLDLLDYHPVTKTTWIMAGIYAWEGDRLKWCLSTLTIPIEGQSLATIDSMHPKKFETAAKGPLEYQVLVILERLKEPVEVPKRLPESGGMQAMTSQEYREAVAAQTKAIEAERLLDQRERQLKFASDNDRLLGTWRVVSDEHEGRKIEVLLEGWEPEYWNFSQERVDSWHAAAPDFGGTDDGKPAGERKACERRQSR